jgi:uncharacterized coiled-coil protein SlyX
MTRQQVQTKIDETNKQLTEAKAELSKASCKYKKLNNDLNKLYKEMYEAEIAIPVQQASAKK